MKDFIVKNKKKILILAVSICVIGLSFLIYPLIFTDKKEEIKGVSVNYQDGDTVLISNISDNYTYEKEITIKNNNKVKNNDETDFFTRLKKKMLIRLIIQGITMTVIFVFCLSVKYMNLKIVKNSEICKKIIKEFKKNYSKTNRKEKDELFI